MIRTRMTVVVAAAAVAAMAISGVALGVGTVVAKSKPATVCVGKKGGGLYSAHKCKKGDKKLTLPAGPRGARGAAGVAGSPGAKGDTGATGAAAVPATTTIDVACGSDATSSGNALRAALANVPTVQSNPLTTTAVLLAPCTYLLSSPLSVPPAVSLVGELVGVAIHVAPTTPQSTAAVDEVATSGLRLHENDQVSGVNIASVTEGTSVGADGNNIELDHVQVSGLSEEPHPYDVLASTGAVLTTDSLELNGPMVVTGLESTLTNTLATDLRAGEAITVAGTDITFDGLNATLDSTTTSTSGPTADVNLVSGSMTLANSTVDAQQDSARPDADAAVRGGVNTALTLTNSSINYNGNEAAGSAAIATAGRLTILRSNVTAPNSVHTVLDSTAGVALLVQQSLLDGGKPSWAGTTPICEASYSANTLLTGSCG